MYSRGKSINPEKQEKLDNMANSLLQVERRNGCVMTRVRFSILWEFILLWN